MNYQPRGSFDCMNIVKENRSASVDPALPMMPNTSLPGIFRSITFSIIDRRAYEQQYQTSAR